MQRTMITGANRGLGLEITRQLLEMGSQVWATCRQPDTATGLAELSSRFPRLLSVNSMDITDDGSIASAVDRVRRDSPALDILINNAGILTRGEQIGNLDRAVFRRTLDTNTIGPAFLVQRALPMLRNGDHPIIANITSQLGSLTRKQSGGLYSYSASKAALNMVSRALAAELRHERITVLAIHPGWVRTDMGGSGAALSVEESAAGIIAVLKNAQIGDTGRFLTWDNRDLPW